MSNDAKGPGEPIRMVFELAREDHPRLYDDLIRFPKGTKRINRLRVLAHDGLLMQSAEIALVGHMASGSTLPDRDVVGEATMLTNGLFAPSLKD